MPNSQLRLKKLQQNKYKKLTKIPKISRKMNQTCKRKSLHKEKLNKYWMKKFNKPLKVPHLQWKKKFRITFLVILTWLSKFKKMQEAAVRLLQFKMNLILMNSQRNLNKCLKFILRLNLKKWKQILLSQLKSKQKPMYSIYKSFPT